MLIVTMLTTILLCSHLYIRSASSKMLEEAGEYSYQINNWVTEQESIMNMFVNSISANPAMLDDYDGRLRMCLVLNDELSDFSIVVLKDTWKMYGGIVPYAALYIVLFSSSDKCGKIYRKMHDPLYDKTNRNDRRN